VNEDLYRELHKSCQGLDSSLQHTDQEIQRAIRTDGLLKKDLGHATAEMTRIAIDCAEEVDSIAINRHTRAQLLHQFENSFMRIIDPQRLYYLRYNLISRRRLKISALQRREFVRWKNQEMKPKLKIIS